MNKRLLLLPLALICALFAIQPAYGQDLTTMLSKFLVDLRAGTWGINQPVTSVRVAAGSTASVPGVQISGSTVTGLYDLGPGNIGFTVAGSGQAGIFAGTLQLPSSVTLGWASGAINTTTDTKLNRTAAGVATLTHGTTTSTAEFQVSGGSGSVISAVKALTELTTIAAAATTNTAIQLPANAVILAVSVRVVTIIPTAATFTVTSATPAKTWNTAAVLVAAGTTDQGTAPGPTFQTTASVITITPNLTPGTATGQVRVTVYYYQVTPATS